MRVSNRKHLGSKKQSRVTGISVCVCTHGAPSHAYAGPGGSRPGCRVLQGSALLPDFLGPHHGPSPPCLTVFFFFFYFPGKQAIQTV